MPCDYSKYPKDWKAIRAEVLERAGHECEQCKAPNGYWIYRGTSQGRPVYQVATLEVYCAETGEMLADNELSLCEVVGLNGDTLTKVVLTISHTDHDITNNGEPGNRPNLRALCQRCHNRHDAEYRRGNARRTIARKKGQQALFSE